MKLNSPIYVHWELTNLCNLKCLHCYQQNDISKASLPENSVFLIAEKLIRGEIFQVTLTGGEPFTLPYIETLVRYFNSYSIFPQISSNGTFIDEKIIRWLSDVKIRLLQISLDSSQPEIHDFIRQSKGAFDKVINSIALLQKSNIPVSIAFCASNKNYHEIESLLKLAISLGLSKVSIGEIMPLYGKNSESLSFNKFEYIQFLEHMNHVQAKYSKEIEIEHISEWGFLYTQDAPHQPCTAMDRDMAILYDGSVVPCPFIRHPNYILGNLQHQSLKEVWQGKLANAWRDNKHLGCESSCKLYNSCMSGCKAFLANTGVPINTPNTHCAMLDTSFVSLISLSD